IYCHAEEALDGRNYNWQRQLRTGASGHSTAFGIGNRAGFGRRLVVCRDAANDGRRGGIGSRRRCCIYLMVWRWGSFRGCGGRDWWSSSRLCRLQLVLFSRLGNGLLLWRSPWVLNEHALPLALSSFHMGGRL